MRKWWTHH